MPVDQVLKELLQLCADTQDGFWEAANSAKAECLPMLFQKFAVQWNEFSDRVFPVLLKVNHTSPHARWKADPDRVWMNPVRDNLQMDDLAICTQCLHGLDLARTRIKKLSEAGYQQVAVLLGGQLDVVNEQAAAIDEFIAGRKRDLI